MVRLFLQNRASKCSIWQKQQQRMVVGKWKAEKHIFPKSSTQVLDFARTGAEDVIGEWWDSFLQDWAPRCLIWKKWWQRVVDREQKGPFFAKSSTWVLYFVKTGKRMVVRGRWDSFLQNQAHMCLILQKWGQGSYWKAEAWLELECGHWNLKESWWGRFKNGNMHA